MFHWHAIILDLMEVNPMNIKDEQFAALELLKTERQLLVLKAKELHSFAYGFYFLLLTFQQLK